MERSSLFVNKKSETRVALGTIVAPHGVRGDLRIRPDIERPEVLRKMKSLMIGDRTYTLVHAAPHKNIWLLHLTGVDDRNASEALVRKEVSAAAKDIPPLPPGEYYYFQLLGLEVREENGNVVGPIKEIIQTGANDVYVVGLPDGKELCLPAIPQVILAVDTDERRMTVKLQEWE